MIILVGHFLTRTQAAHRAGIRPDELRRRPDLLRVGGTWLEEVYFEFQFDKSGIRPDLGGVVRTLHKTFDDLTIADWLARPNPQLHGKSPLQWARSGGNHHHLVEALVHAGPSPTHRYHFAGGIQGI
jgi:hypothetical protein